jgi:hypothetical protein
VPVFSETISSRRVRFGPPVGVSVRVISIARFPFSGGPGHRLQPGVWGVVRAPAPRILHH